MRSAPRFWWLDRPSAAARLLSPVGHVYGAVTARRMARDGAQLAAPVLCVGNFVAGGAGKTPTAVTLAALLVRLGHRPAFVSRGYGRADALRPDEVIAVDRARHTAAEVGDEPLLLARAAPTYVARDRTAAGRRAIADGATMLVLDDGLQNPAPRKDLTFAVVDGRTGVGNGLCVPAGPLRAPLDAQWPHVTALCVIGPGARGEAVAALARERGVRVWPGRLEPESSVIQKLTGRPLYAFAGIGQPTKFFETLQACGLSIAAMRAFPDHHPFTARDIAELRRDADRCGAVLVTTEKDRVRCPVSFPVETLPVTLSFGNEDAVLAFLADRLRPSRNL